MISADHLLLILLKAKLLNFQIEVRGTQNRIETDVSSSTTTDSKDFTNSKMTSRPICTNSSTQVQMSKGLSESEESRGCLVKTFRTQDRCKSERKTKRRVRAYDEKRSDRIREAVFSIPTGLLSNLPMIHRENETDPIFVDLIKSNIPEEESPRLQKRKSASKISTIAKVERQSLA